jgi:hypothetical protein
MSIWGCGSSATFCQPAAAADFIYCRSQEWALHSLSPADFVYLEFSWMRAPFVFSSIHTYPPVAIAVLFYLQFTWGSAPFPLSGGACHTLATVGRLPLSKHTGGGGATPTFSNRLVYLQLMWGSAPPPLSGAQGTPPSLLCVFYFSAACLLFSLFFSFFPGWGSVCPGGLLICPRLVCGSTACCLFAHLVVCISQAG